LDAIRRFADHVVDHHYRDIPPAAIESAKVFLLDTLGVGVAGSSGPFVPELIDSQRLSAGGDQARVWVTGERLSAAGAALCNSYQIHNAEFDCVHEAAVVHTMTVVSAAALAYAERTGGVDGESLLAALVLGVDVACHVSVASNASLSFFRPGTAGAFAATAALGKLRGFDAETLVNAFGATLTQLCGTMQAHTEGSIALGMQIGFNARNAILSADLAGHGLVAPQDVLEGPFGFYRLFEGSYDLEPVLGELGKTWRITEVAHKPFPCGRATHGVIDAALELRREHGFEWHEVVSGSAKVPSLVHHLVGRAIGADMELNYARLCAQYTIARALMTGGVSVTDFYTAPLHDAQTLELGQRIEIAIDDNPDPNALTPVALTLNLNDGRTVEANIEVVYGNPARPMTRAAQLEKLEANWNAARRTLPDTQREALVAAVDGIESMTDVTALVDCVVTP